MWEWRGWRKVAPGEPCRAGLVFSMDLATGTNHAGLPDRLRAKLDAAEAASGGDADEQPLSPFPPQPESAPGVAAEGEGQGDVDVAVEDTEEEVEYGSGESALALMYEDTAEPDVYVSMDAPRQTRRCCPCPPRYRPLPCGAVSSGTAGLMRPRMSTTTASRATGGKRRRCW